MALGKKIRGKLRVPHDKERGFLTQLLGGVSLKNRVRADRFNAIRATHEGKRKHLLRARKRSLI